MRRQNNKESGESKSNENRTKLQDVKIWCGRRNAWRQTVNGGKQRGGKGTEGVKEREHIFQSFAQRISSENTVSLKA